MRHELTDEEQALYDAGGWEYSRLLDDLIERYFDAARAFAAQGVHV